MKRRKSGNDASSSKVNAGMPTRRGSGAAANKLKIGRSKSASDSQNPRTQWKSIKGIMKFATLDESLHSRYGSESGSDDGTKKKKIRIQFENIEIREYDRTVGDNPSVSSGKFYHPGSVEATVASCGNWMR